MNSGRKKVVLYQLAAKRGIRLAFYSCWGYIFTIGWEFEYLLIMDTHAIFQELSGKGNGLVKIFLQDDRQLAAEDLRVCGYGNDSVRMELRALLRSLLLRWWSTSNSTEKLKANTYLADHMSWFEREKRKKKRKKASKPLTSLKPFSKQHFIPSSYRNVCCVQVCTLFIMLCLSLKNQIAKDTLGCN